VVTRSLIDKHELHAKESMVKAQTKHAALPPLSGVFKPATPSSSLLLPLTYRRPKLLIMAGSNPAARRLVRWTQDINQTEQLVEELSPRSVRQDAAPVLDQNLTDMSDRSS
jgi:hypothetical protein